MFDVQRGRTPAPFQNFEAPDAARAILPPERKKLVEDASREQAATARVQTGASAEVLRCEAAIRDLRRRVDRGEPAAIYELAGFLAWSSRGWSRGLTLEVRRTLCALGSRAIGPVLGTVADRPREDVIDAAEIVLADVLDADVGGVDVVSDVLRALDGWAPRAAAARALGRATREESHKRRLELLVGLLAEGPVLVQSAAAEAINDLGDAAALPALRTALAAGATGYAAQAIHEAIEALQ